jgi:arabinogalactan oligomer/maltooligosaccharide transport system substrate-binding protein
MIIRRIVSLLAVLFCNTMMLWVLLLALSLTRDVSAQTALPLNSKSANVLNIYTVTVWAGNNPVLTNIINDFQTAYPTITVQIIITDFDGIGPRFANAARSGSGPDLLGQLPNDTIIYWASQGLVRSVDTDFNLSLFLTDTVDGIAWQGNHWGVPEINGNHLMLLYNKALLSTPPTNTATLITVAQTFTGSTYGLVYDPNNAFYLMPWLGGFGGWPLDVNADPITPTLNTSAMVNTLQFVHDLKYVHHVLSDTCDYGCAETAFMQGKAAMLINGDWSLSNYTNLSPTVQLGIARIPLVSATGLWPSPMTSGKYYAFNSYTSDQQFQVSRLFVQFATTKSEQLRWVQASQFPARIDAFLDPSVQNDPILQASAYQLAVGRPMPGIPEMRCAWDAISPSLVKVMSNTLAPDVAATQMQDSTVTCINQLRPAGVQITVSPATSNTLVFTDTHFNPTTIFVPSGAVTESVDLIYTPVPTVTLPPQLSLAGHAFTLVAYQSGTVLSSFNFQQPITVTLSYNDADVAGINESSLTLNYWDGGSWVDAATSCTPSSTYDRHPAENWLAISICHLSRFALFGPTEYRLYLPLVNR